MMLKKHDVPTNFFLTLLLVFSFLFLFGCNDEDGQGGPAPGVTNQTEEDGKVETITHLESEEDILALNIENFLEKVEQAPHITKTVKCNSKDLNYKECKLSKRNRIAQIELLEEKSDDKCDGNFGITEDNLSIFVDEGCQATFSVIQNKSHYLKCKSKNLAEKICKAQGNILSYELYSTFDNSGDCIKGETFSLLNANSIMVKEGCQAKFLVETDRILVNANNKNGWESLSPKAAASIEVDELFNVSFDQDVPVEEEITYNDNGLGVLGGNPVSEQINFFAGFDTTEGLVFDLKKNTLRARIHISNLFKNERSGERGKVLAYDEDYNLIAEKILDKETVKYNSNNHQGKTVLKSTSEFRYLLFIALPYPEQGEMTSDSSDYFVRKISFDF